MSLVLSVGVGYLVHENEVFSMIKYLVLWRATNCGIAGMLVVFRSVRKRWLCSET